MKLNEFILFLIYIHFSVENSENLTVFMKEQRYNMISSAALYISLKYFTSKFLKSYCKMNNEFQKIFHIKTAPYL